MKTVIEIQCWGGSTDLKTCARDVVHPRPAIFAGIDSTNRNLNRKKIWTKNIFYSWRKNILKIWNFSFTSKFSKTQKEISFCVLENLLVNEKFQIFKIMFLQEFKIKCSDFFLFKLRLVLSIPAKIASRGCTTSRAHAFKSVTPPQDWISITVFIIMALQSHQYFRNVILLVTQSWGS